MKTIEQRITDIENYIIIRMKYRIEKVLLSHISKLEKRVDILENKEQHE